MITSLAFVFIHSLQFFSPVSAENDSNSPIQNVDCVLPPYPEHGKYTVSNYPSARPGESYPSVKLDVSCDTGYQNENNTNSIFCVTGYWSATMPACVRFCTLTEDLSVEYRCVMSGQGSVKGSRECESLVPSGTVVTPVCRSPHYSSPDVLAQMRCIDGIWDYKATCKPVCGRISPHQGTLLLGGTTSNHVELPWHAVIYRKDFNPYMQICGGSLITATKIISAAHCFWTDIMKKLPASNFAVAVGKRYRPYNTPQDIHSQKSTVVDIKMPVRFQGAATNLQDDIAIVTVETPFIYDPFVQPVCLDFDYNLENIQLTDGIMGKGASWNIGGKKLSPVLKTVDVPYIKIEDCLNMSPPDFRKYLSDDKFCAGFNNGTSFCRGDSGGGLAFLEPTTQRYYLRGVLSTSPNNEDICPSFSAFTSIIKHEQFIKSYIY